MLRWLVHLTNSQRELLVMVVFARKARKNLSADSLFRMLRSAFDCIPDPRMDGAEIGLGDALMSGFAMFSLKDPSLLAFDERRHDPNDNFRTIFGIDSVPCDTQMRAILDPVDPEKLRPLFGDVFRRLQRGKALEPFVYLHGHYLMSLDGTTYFSSEKVHCESRTASVPTPRTCATCVRPACTTSSASSTALMLFSSSSCGPTTRLVQRNSSAKLIRPRVCCAIFVGTMPCP
jgi:hypothetical protein